MRALSKDIETTGLMGVNTNRIIMFAFMLGSALAASAVFSGLSNSRRSTR